MRFSPVARRRDAGPCALRGGLGAFERVLRESHENPGLRSSVQASSGAGRRMLRKVDRRQRVANSRLVFFGLHVVDARRQQTR